MMIDRPNKMEPMLASRTVDSVEDWGSTPPNWLSYSALRPPYRWSSTATIFCRSIKIVGAATGFDIFSAGTLPFLKQLGPSLLIVGMSRE
jgi:hypothetical protein